MAEQTPIIDFESVSKVYGSCTALKRVSFRVRPGSIHAVIGENGAGKSTAMKILYGMTKPTTGIVCLRGQKVNFRSPEDALAAGVGMVHQHFMLSGPETVLENIVLGSEGALGALLPWSQSRARAKLEEVMSSSGLRVDPAARVEDLPVGLQQRVEILKALYKGAKILILDEPTAVLLPQEVDGFFAQIQRLRDLGTTVLVVTHKLREVKTFTDHVTVLRAGESVLDSPTSELSYEQLGEAIVGRAGMFAKVHEAIVPGVAGAKVLRTPGLRGFEDFHVAKGEIVGIAGVEGSGQRELLRAICEPNRLSAGSVYFEDRDTSRSESGEIREQGLAHIPGDRHEEACVLDRDLEWNFALGRQREFYPGSRWIFGGVQARNILHQTAEDATRSWEVKPAGLELQFRSLSGGNQQKFVVGRELTRNPKLVVAVHPTRGVDLGAVDRIHRGLVTVRDQGAGVVLVSSELDELLKLSDRVYVVSGGKLIREFRRGEVDERKLGVAMGGVEA